MSHAFTARFTADSRFTRLLPYVLGLLLIAINFGMALIYLANVRSTNARAEHSQQVMLLLKQMEDLTEASGMEQRNYRLSGDPRCLDAARKAQLGLAVPTGRLRGLIAGDASQLRRLDSLTELFDRDAVELATDLTPIEVHFSDGRLPPGLAAGVAWADAVTTAINSMLDHERNLLHDELAASESTSATMLGTGTLGRTIGVVIVVGVYVVASRRAQQAKALAAVQLAALQESEQRFARVFRESPIGILLAEPDSRIVQANPAFCRMLGADAAQFVGKTMAELAHVNDRDLLTDALRHGTGPDQGIEVRYVTRSGAIAWASVRLTRSGASDGHPGLLLALTEDITRHKRVEAELRQAQKMEAIGQLTGGIAHDFNNLLGVIIGNVEFLIDTATDANQAAMAKEILDSALSGADLTRRLLAFARRQPLQPRQIDLNAYLPNHVAIVRRLLGEQVTVTTDLAPDLWPTRADPSQVGDALLNLAINARDAMPHGGTISIATANAHLSAHEQDEEVVPGDYIVMSVTDTGIGMPPEVLERVVEPFFTTKGPGAGSGLGLSMIFGFARQSGGHLRIDSEPGQGTTVRLYLPRAQVEAADEADDATDLPLPKGDEMILLVDDNADMRAVARRHLVSLGYRVSEAASGPEALAVLQAGGSFDLLFTDVVMPDGMTGYQLAAAARRLRPGLKVLFTTGFVRPEQGSEVAEASAGQMIRKPYRRQELATTVRVALEA